MNLRFPTCVLSEARGRLSVKVLLTLSLSLCLSLFPEAATLRRSPISGLWMKNKKVCEPLRVACGHLFSILPLHLGQGEVGAAPSAFIDTQNK